MRDSRGFAIVIVVLVSSIALLAFLFSSATLTLASRSAASQERGATQALLAADSGLKTLVARAAANEYRPGVHGTMTNWINSTFGTLDLGGGVSAELVLLNVPSAANGAIIQSTGRAGTSRRVLIQEFEIVEGPPIAASVAVPGALTSVGNINNSSNAMRIHGRLNTEAAWTYSPVALCTAAQGEYFVTGGFTYEVLDETPSCGGPVNVQRVGGATMSLPGNTSGVHRPIATSQTMTSTTVNGTTTSTVEVTDGARVLFGVGTPITIGTASGGGPSLGTVTAADGNVLTISWSVPPATTNPPEGTVIRREVSSGVTAGACNIREAAFPEGCDGSQNLDNLFFKTFGIADPQLLKDSLSGSQRISNSQLRDGRVLSGITWLTNPENNTRGQTGSGILIIENNPGQSITLNVHNQFTGLIYVIGDANIQGNSEMIGALVVDGAATISTSVQGNGDKVRYDPLQLARALSNITFPNPDAGGIGGALANTWRVR